MNRNKTWLVHLVNPYEARDVWGCGACIEHIEFAKKHNMLVLVDDSGDIQGVTFNHVLGRDVKTIKLKPISTDNYQTGKLK